MYFKILSYPLCFFLGLESLSCFVFPIIFMCARVPLKKRVSGIVGSQFLITIGEGEDMALDGLHSQALYLGHVVEDDNDVLRQINSLYCDKDGRPYTDVRIKRALIVHDPFEDPPGMENLLKYRGIVQMNNINENSDYSSNYCMSPEYAKPPEEQVEERIAADDKDLLQENANEEDEEVVAKREEELERREAKSRAVVLEMLGDLPDADVAPAENVLFVCKLNPITTDDDLTLIFSRFDANARATVIRDPITQDSLCYAFVEFTSPQPCTEAYFKMNNVLIDDRRIKVDFSQSVSKEWNRYTQTRRRQRQGLAPNAPLSRVENQNQFRKKKHSNNPLNSRPHAAAFTTTSSHTGSNVASLINDNSYSKGNIDDRNGHKRSAESPDDYERAKESRKRKKHKKDKHGRSHKYVDDESRSISTRSNESQSSESYSHRRRHRSKRSPNDSSSDERHYRKKRRKSHSRHPTREESRHKEDSRRRHSSGKNSRKKHSSRSTH